MATASTSSPPHRWPWFLIGLAVFLLGPALVFVQFRIMEKLATPWQLPILATLGALCMLLSVLQRGGVLRIAGFMLFAFLSGFEWYLMVVLMSTVDYHGPTADNPLPVFAAKYADGRAFTNADLAKGQSTVMLFYRGHW